MAVIVGICGYAQSGKGTCAEALIKRGFVQVSFADPLKLAVNLVYNLIDPAGLTEQDLLDKLSEPVFKATPHYHLNGKTPREAYQFLGNKGFRGFLDVSFTEHYHRRVNNLLYCENKNVVTPDVRFPNEWLIIKQFKGSKLGSVWREEIIATKGIYKDESESHIPLLREVADFEVANLTTVEDLQKKFLERLESLVEVV